MEDLMIHNILESMTDSLMVIGPMGEIVYANKATEEVLGCGLDALRTNGLGVTFFTREDNYDFNQMIVDAIQQKAVKRYNEVQYYHPDGSVKRLAVTTSYLVDLTKSPDSFVGFMAICKDITEVFALRQSEKRLLEDRQRVANEKAQSLQKLAAGVAHEIRNPTVTVGGFATRLLKMKELPETAWECARKILDGAKRLESLVEEVERYCDITHADLTEQDIAGIVRKSLQELAHTAGDKNIVLRFQDDTTGVFLCHCDAKLVSKALLQLLHNAIDFSPEGGLVEAGVSGTDETVTIEIRDFGAGIQPEDLNYIHDPFFSTVPDRAGMGLAVVQRIVNEHMGTFTVESEHGQGTRVQVCLPRRQKRVRA
jgi:PAS domain S-box-containing protein